MPLWKMSKKPIGDWPSNTIQRRILRLKHKPSLPKFPKLTPPSLNPKKQGLMKIMDLTVSLKISRRKSTQYSEIRQKKSNKLKKLRTQNRLKKARKKARRIMGYFTLSPATTKQSMGSR